MRQFVERSDAVPLISREDQIKFITGEYPQIELNGRKSVPDESWWGTWREARASALVILTDSHCGCLESCIEGAIIQGEKTDTFGRVCEVFRFDFNRYEQLRMAKEQEAQQAAIDTQTQEMSVLQLVETLRRSEKPDYLSGLRALRSVASRGSNVLYLLFSVEIALTALMI